MKKFPIYVEIPKTLTNRWRIIGISIIIVCLASTFGMWALMEQTNDGLASANVDAQTEQVIDQLERRLEVYGDLLYGGRGLFLQNPDLTSAEWNTFMASQNLFERYPGTNSVGYLEVADSAEASRIEAEINQNVAQEGLPPVTLFRLPLTDRIAILKYLTRVAEYRVLGLNAFSIDVLVPVIESASMSGVPEATPPFISPNPERSDIKDVVILLAVYNDVVSETTSAEDREAALSGFVSLSIHPEILIKKAIDQMSDNGSIDVRVETNDTLIYQRSNEVKEAHVEKLVSIDVAGQTWQFTFYAPEQYGLSWREKFAPSFMLVVGLVIMVSFIATHLYAGGIRFRRRV